MMHGEILREEEFFGEFYADTFSDCPSNINTSISEDDSSSEYTYDSGDVKIRPTERQKNLTDSDTDSKNETHGDGECTFASA